MNAVSIPSFLRHFSPVLKSHHRSPFHLLSCQIYASDIRLSDMEKWFHLPARQAASKLGVGLTVFKRCARNLGIEVWPYKKPISKLGEAGIHNPRRLFSKNSIVQVQLN